VASATVPAVERESAEESFKLEEQLVTQNRASSIQQQAPGNHCLRTGWWLFVATMVILPLRAEFSFQQVEVGNGGDNDPTTFSFYKDNRIAPLLDARGKPSLTPTARSSSAQSVPCSQMTSTSALSITPGKLDTRATSRY
jgi:hypothetical protein